MATRNSIGLAAAAILSLAPALLAGAAAPAAAQSALQPSQSGTTIVQGLPNLIRGRWDHIIQINEPKYDDRIVATQQGKGNDLCRVHTWVEVGNWGDVAAPASTLSMYVDGKRQVVVPVPPLAWHTFQKVEFDLLLKEGQSNVEARIDEGNHVSETIEGDNTSKALAIVYANCDGNATLIPGTQPGGMQTPTGSRPATGSTSLAAKPGDDHPGPTVGSGTLRPQTPVREILFADLMAAPNAAMIGGTFGNWNARRVIKDQNIKQREAGRGRKYCMVDAMFVISNIGNNSADNFRARVIVNDGDQVQVFPGLSAGETWAAHVNTTLFLKSGQNKVELRIDDNNKVKESNESNNVYVAPRVYVMSDCDGKKKPGQSGQPESAEPQAKPRFMNRSGN